MEGDTKGIPMGTFTRASSNTGRRMAKAGTNGRQAGKFMTGNGREVCDTGTGYGSEWVKRSKIHTWGNGNMGRQMDKGCILGATGISMRAVGKRA